MALPTASDNAFPSLLLTEGTVPAAPAAGKHRLYVDTADKLLKWEDSGAIVRLATGQPLGLTGAVSATRYVGGTASVAPTTGTFAIGDFVITQAGGIYICTIAGTPGTWVAVSGGGGSVATDAIWDAAGDLAVGTGANTAARLASGGVGTSLIGSGVGAAPTWADRIGRKYSVIASELNTGANTDVFDGGVAAYLSGTGAAMSAGTPAGNHPGVVALSTGTTTTGRTAIGNGNSLVELGGGKVRFGLVAKLTTLSDATDTYTVRGGLSDAFADDGADDIGFRYSHGVNAGEWQGICRANSVETALDTNVLADTNWHTFEFEVNAAASSVEFFIDGVSKGTIATNIPSGAARVTGTIPCRITKAAGTTARLVSVDAYWYIFEFTTAR